MEEGFGEKQRVSPILKKPFSTLIPRLLAAGRFINEDGISQIPPSACMGCGICVSECPSKAITLKHCTDDQLLAKIDALLEPTDSFFPFPRYAG